MIAFDLREETVEAYSTDYREDWHKKNKKDGDEGSREFRAMQRGRSLEKRGYV